MSKFPWRKKDDEPALEDLLDELPPSLDRGDEADVAVPLNEEEELLDQYVASESLSDGSVDTESVVDAPDGVTVPDLSIDIDPDEAEDASESEDVSDDVMSIFDDEVEQDEDMAALSRGLDEVDVVELLEQARSIDRMRAWGCSLIPNATFSMPGGRDWSMTTVYAGMAALEADYEPLTDMRASRDYRLKVAKNLLYKFYLETTGGAADTRVVAYGT